MTGYAVALGPCWACRELFSFNPHLVPSITVDGSRRPLCESCIDAANVVRRRMGLEPVRVEPGAYGPVEGPAL